MIRFLMHWLGLDNAGGPSYLFWSGFFGDIVIFGALGSYYHKHNCHTNGCKRIGKHVYNGTPYCTKHHPAGFSTKPANGLQLRDQRGRFTKGQL